MAYCLPAPTVSWTERATMCRLFLTATTGCMWHDVVQWRIARVAGGLRSLQGPT